MTMKITAQRIVDRFNAQYPKGTHVDYWPGVREGPGRADVTASEAFLLGGHTPVVFILGERACIALTHIRPVKTK